jgi:predicted exporter
MSRWLALAWLVLVLVAGSYLALRAMDGIDLRTDLLALLPKEEQDPALSLASDRIMQKVAGRVILLVGSQDRAAARRAAAEIEDSLVSTKLVTLDGFGTSPEGTAALGAFYIPYRTWLLADRDRRLLADGNGAAIAERAMAQVYGVGSFADSRLLAADPFLLLPSFLGALPVPSSRLALDEGRLTVAEHNMTWILIAGRLLGDPYELDTQERLTSTLDTKIGALATADRSLEVKRTGAVFFARAGANTGLTEASVLGSISLVGTVALLLVVFWHALPLILNVGTLLVGTGAALAATLAIFGEVHIMTLLFGVGLIGVAVDYGLHYSTSSFDPAAGSPHERLLHVLPAITLGLLTTLIGYIILVLAPFPGLRQIAVFSTFGLVAAFLTVALWFPFLGNARPPRHRDVMMCWVEAPWRFWEIAQLRPLRWTALIVLGVLGIVGLMRLTSDDDVRRMQSLSPDLVAQQADIQRLTGVSGGWQNVLVMADDDEAALRSEESLAQVLNGLMADGAIGGYRAPASFVPSSARQRENAMLVEDRLMTPFLAAQQAQLGLISRASAPSPASAPLTLAKALEDGAAPFLADLVLGPGQHLVALESLKDEAALRRALSPVAGVKFIDPAGDFTILLTKYRHRAIWLIGFSAILMLAPLWWRYGARGAATIMAPAVAAVVLAPALIALTGEAISFFHVMALVLVLSIGVDFAIFCAEASTVRRSSASLAVVLAAMTTWLSFGVLAFSRVFAVHAFGLTLLLGVLLAFLLAPVALRVRPIRHRRSSVETVG